MKKLNIHGRCIAICSYNDYEEDCAGVKRLSDKELAKRAAEERNLH